MKRLGLPDGKIKRLYLGGKGAPEIAEIYGCDTVTIYNRLRKMGVPIRSRYNMRRSILKNPTKDEIIYFAGILDGEGSIPRIKSDTCRGGVHPEIGVANNSLELMEWLSDKFGYGYTEKTHYASNHLGKQRIFQWRVRRLKDVHRLLKLSYPYLIVKKERAREVIKYLEMQYSFDPVLQEEWLVDQIGGTPEYTEEVIEE
jgi:hypothetical protein